MNHQEAKDILGNFLPADSLSLIKVEVFRLSWEGKGYNHVADETGYDHDYVRKAGSQLWKELTSKFDTSVTKRNFRPLLEEQLVKLSSQRTLQLEYPGGAMSFSSPFYIERTEEESRVYREILQPGSVVRIKGPRKMGKSSLMLRVLDQAESEGFGVVTIDLLQADHAILSDIDRLLRWLCHNICAQLKLDESPDDNWNELIGSKLSCSNYIHSILQQRDTPLVLVLKELNQVFDYEQVSRDFLPLLRSWFEESKHSDDMKKLRQVLVYSTEVYVQLDLNLSPFNIGLPIELQFFNGQQLEQLAQVYGFNWRADGTVSSPITVMLTELGGHPYLCQLALYHLASQDGLLESPSKALQEFLVTGADVGGIYSDFLQQLHEDIVNNERAINGFNKLHCGEADKLSRIETYQLERLGLARLMNGQAKTTSRLLSDYLKTVL